MQKYLLVCPLECELRPLLDGFAELGHEVKNGPQLKVTTHWIPSKGILIAKGGHGKIQFGIQTNYLVTQLTDLSGVICVGAGGALAPHLNVGDVVVAEKTIEHDYLEKFNPKAICPEFHAHPTLIDRFRRQKKEFPFNVHFGSVASGDEDIVDSKRAEELYLSTQSLAVAWEGAGGARACKFNGLPYLEIRVITDNARSAVSDSFIKNLNPCMKNIANFVHAVVS